MAARCSRRPKACGDAAGDALNLAELRSQRSEKSRVEARGIMEKLGYGPDTAFKMPLTGSCHSLSTRALRVLDRCSVVKRMTSLILSTINRTASRRVRLRKRWGCLGFRGNGRTQAQRSNAGNPPACNHAHPVQRLAGTVLAPDSQLRRFQCAPLAEFWLKSVARVETNPRA